MPPRIAIIAEKYGGIGGSERFVQEVTERLAATNQYEFHVFANRWQSSCKQITFHKVPRIKFPRFLRPWFFTAVAQRMIARGKFDLVHSHWPTFHADVFSTHGAPHAYWMKHILQRRPRLFDRTMMMIDRRMIANGSNTIFMPVSSFVQQRFAEIFGSLPGTWKVVHPGVDTEKFTHNPIARAEVRQLHNIAPTACVALFVGMNFETKGLDRLLAICAHIKKINPQQPLHTLVVGRGNTAKYQRIADQLGIGADITFAGPQLTNIERYFSAADILVMLSKFETFCMVVLEAMAAGLPVIISDQMGVQDLVRDGENGFVVSASESVQEIALRLEGVMEGSQRQALGASARATSLRHGWSHVADAVSSIYNARLKSQRQAERSVQ